MKFRNLQFDLSTLSNASMASFLEKMPQSYAYDTILRETSLSNRTLASIREGVILMKPVELFSDEEILSVAMDFVSQLLQDRAHKSFLVHDEKFLRLNQNRDDECGRVIEMIEAILSLIKPSPSFQVKFIVRSENCVWERVIQYREASSYGKKMHLSLQLVGDITQLMTLSDSQLNDLEEGKGFTYDEFYWAPEHISEVDSLKYTLAWLKRNLSTVSAKSLIVSFTQPQFSCFETAVKQTSSGEVSTGLIVMIDEYQGSFERESVNAIRDELVRG